MLTSPRPFFALVVLLCATLSSASKFHPAAEYTVPGHADAIAAGDFNNDGIMDLVTHAFLYPKGGDLISTLFGNGDGTLRNGFTTEGSVKGYSSIVVGDFNHDGNLDVGGSDGSGDFAVRLGTGDGRFQAALLSPAGQDLEQAAVGDFNGDGILDAAVTDALAQTISVLLGKGDGTFERGDSYSIGGADSDYGVIVGNLNGDSHLDIIATSGRGGVVVLLGNGDGTFQQMANLSTLGTSLAVGDFNGDGELDVLAANQFGETVTSLLGDGTGELALKWSKANVGEPTAIAVADFNHDGILDFALSQILGRKVGIFIGKGDGTFYLAENLSSASYTGDVSNVAADFNRDGWADLALVDDNYGLVLVYLNQGR